MKNSLDREDSINFRRSLKQLNKWIDEYIKKNKSAHPFLVVGANKWSDHDRVSNQNQ